MEYKLLALFLIVSILFSGCTEKPTGRVVSAPETKYVCPDGSVVNDPKDCPTTTTTTSTTQIESSISPHLTATTSSVTSTVLSTSTTTCGESRFNVGDLVETTPLYDTKGGRNPDNSHVEGNVIEIEEISCGEYMIRIKTTEGQRIGLIEKWIQVKTTTTTTMPVIEERDFKLEVISKYKRRSVGKGYFTVDADPGKIFLIVRLEILNTGDSQDYITYGDFLVKDLEGYIYEASSATIWLDDRIEGGSLFPGTKKSGKVVFEVRDSAEFFDLIFDPNFLIDGDEIIVDL